MQLLIRSWNIVHGLLGRLVSRFERRNPEALLERERERFRASVAQFNQGLVIHATLAERLKSQIASSGDRCRELALRLRAVLTTGDERTAGRLAFELKALELSLAGDRKKLDAAEAAYRQLLETRDTAVVETRAKLEELRFQIGDLKVNRAVADLENMAAGMIGRINDPGDGLNRLKEMVVEENEKARAKVRVAGRPALELDPEIRAVERNLLDSEALAEFRMRDVAGEPLALPDFSTSPQATPRKPIKH